ncbi:hypothetical protein BDW59DRAFT_160139 [Aspergillus cavernicola]|uniref:Uncharacterized protein n=1 Tax=Aspergillus cavernicola TaxID=176166 RepID=A0ABR4IJ71_9EURO
MWKELANILHLGRANIRHTRIQHFQVQQLKTTQRFSAIPSMRASQPQDEKDHYHDRNKLDPSRTESSQSATTDEVATQETAFDPTKTSPESEIRASKEETKQKGGGRSPLGVSAADKDVSRARDPKEGGADRNVETGASSARGRPRKNYVRK